MKSSKLARETVCGQFDRYSKKCQFNDTADHYSVEKDSDLIMGNDKIQVFTKSPSTCTIGKKIIALTQKRRVIFAHEGQYDPSDKVFALSKVNFNAKLIATINLFGPQLSQKRRAVYMKSIVCGNARHDTRPGIGTSTPLEACTSPTSVSYRGVTKRLPLFNPESLAASTSTLVVTQPSLMTARGYVL